MTIFKKDVMEAASLSQFCIRHQAGCEAVIHSVVQTLYEQVDVEGALQLDATNILIKSTER